MMINVLTKIISISLPVWVWGLLIIALGYASYCGIYFIACQVKWYLLAKKNEKAYMKFQGYEDDC